MEIWIALFVVAAAAAAAFAWQVMSRGKALAALETALAEAKMDAEKSRAAEKARGEELGARKAEVADLKEKLKEAKKKLHEERQAEDRLRGAEHELRAEADRAHLKLRDLLAAIEHKDAEITRLRGELEQNKKRRGPPEPKAEPPRPAKVEKPALAPVPPDVAAIEERAKKAEETLRSERARLRDMEEELKKHRGRAETNHRIYLVTKGELEVAKDKLATIERKVREMEGGVRRRRTPQSQPAAAESAEAAPTTPAEPAAPVEPAAEAKPAEAAQTTAG